MANDDLWKSIGTLYAAWFQGVGFGDRQLRVSFRHGRLIIQLCFFEEIKGEVISHTQQIPETELVDFAAPPEHLGKLFADQLKMKIRARFPDESRFQPAPV